MTFKSRRVDGGRPPDRESPHGGAVLAGRRVPRRAGRRRNAADARTAPQGLRPGDRLHQAAVKALAAGKLLVAARRLPDPNFGNAVILLADFNGDGAVGLVVNRRSDVTVARVFPHLTPTLASAGQAFLGGPVEKTRAMVLLRASASPAEARRVLDGIYLLTGREAIESAVTSSTSPGRLRVYLGYAGWGPGQLEAETAEGVWHVLAGDPTPSSIPDPSSTWQRQIARLRATAE